MRINPSRINHARVASVTGGMFAGIAFALAGLTAAGVIHGPEVTSGSTPAGRSVSAAVRNFNDGFTVAKQDDCRSGSRAACTWLRGIPSAAVTATLTAAESISAGTHSPHASGHGDGRTLPAWVKVWHTRYRSGPHGAPCVKIGTAGRPRIGAVCANGKAFVLPLGSPHGRPYSHRDLPRYVRFWTTDSAGVIVIGGGSADTTLQACRTCVPNLQVS